MRASAPLTSGFEEADRALRQICSAYRLVCDRWWEFRGCVRQQRIGSLALAEIRLSPCVLVGDPSEQHRGADEYFLLLQAEGTATLRQRGAEASLAPGDCCVIDPRAPSVLEASQGFVQYAFRLPASRFEEHFGRRMQPLARRIHGDRGAGRVLSELLVSFIRNAATLQDVDLTGTTLQLLSAAAGTDVEATVMHGGERHAISPEEVAHYIDANIQQPELTPQHIADHFGISVRQVYRVVAAAGCTPAALIWKRRLEHARALLARSGSRTPIIEIALNCGFKDGAHFSRSYRKTFGHSPKASRSAVPASSACPAAVSDAPTAA